MTNAFGSVDEVNSIKAIPKGSMCSSCTKKLQVCNHLNFKGMPVFKKFDHYIVVICQEYKSVSGVS